MRTLAIINQKGGCGKTTSAINLAGAFARRGYRTLLVDMDPQSHCAAGLAIPEQRIDLDIGDAMLSTQPVDPTRLLWRAARNLDLAPSRTKVAGLEAMRGGLADKADKEKRLRKVLETLAPSYEVCIIDCSPSIGLLTYNALTAADGVLIPVETSFFSLQGATKQVHTVRSLSKRLGVPFACWLLGTIHDAESPLAKDLLDELRRRFTTRVAPVVIHRDDAIREAASFGQPVIEYSPTSRGARDYFDLAEWLVGRQGLQLDAPSSADPLEGAFDPIETETGVEIVSTEESEAELAKRVSARDAEDVQISRAQDLRNRARAMSRREDI
ncbi:MAG: ParA family protein, partial [Phycisphaerales bacterium]|nr:ParA family protein [Phycisphaerales bacterium]